MNITTQKPLVSIVIPCYNREPYLRDAIDSSLKQTYKNIEIIVVDDGSTDNSVEVVKSYGTKVKLFIQKNMKANAARNQGLRMSKGDFVVFLDSDDWISEDLIEKQIHSVVTWPEAAIYCASSRKAYANGSLSKVVPSNWPKTPNIPIELFLLESPPFPACEMYRKSVLEKFNGFDENSISSDEGETRIRIVLSGYKVVRTEGGYAVYRPVENSVTKKTILLHKYKLLSLRRLKREFGQKDNYIKKIFAGRLLMLRYRYWNAFLSFHTSFKPVEIAKFIYHLLRIMRVDPKYPAFLFQKKKAKQLFGQ